MAEDPRVRAYFDARAPHFDRLYEQRPGPRGRFEEWVYGPLRWSFELTMAELGDLTGKSVLDVGCGPGRYAVAAAERGAEVTGIDVSRKMLALATQRARDGDVAERCRFEESDFDTYRPETRFEIVLMISFLEYRADPRRDLARLGDLAGEKAIVRVPLPHDWRTIARRVRHRLRAAPPSFYVHSPVEIAAALEAAGFARWRTERGWFVAQRPR